MDSKLWFGSSMTSTYFLHSDTVLYRVTGGASAFTAPEEAIRQDTVTRTNIFTVSGLHRTLWNWGGKRRAEQPCSPDSLRLNYLEPGLFKTRPPRTRPTKLRVIRHGLGVGDRAVAIGVGGGGLIVVGGGGGELLLAGTGQEKRDGYAGGLDGLVGDSFARGPAVESLACHGRLETDAATRLGLADEARRVVIEQAARAGQKKCRGQGDLESAENVLVQHGRISLGGWGIVTW